MGNTFAGVTLNGRLTRDSELKYTNSGQAIAHFSVATNDKIKDVETSSFWECDLWGKQGESLNQYLLKGKQVLVIGTMRQESWEKDGVKHSKVKVSVDHLSLGSGGERQESTPNTPPKRVQVDANNPTPFEDDSPVPF